MKEIYENRPAAEQEQESREKAKELLRRFQPRVAAIRSLANEWIQEDDGSNESLGSLVIDFNTFSRDYWSFIESVVDCYDFPISQQNLIDVLGRLQQEWAVISHARMQRRTGQYFTKLKQADAVARAYYDHFEGYRTKGKIVAYFEKLYAVNRFIFSPYALISIPVIFFSQPEHWQALAHEIGHYIYWNSAGADQYRDVHRTLQGKIIQALRQQYDADNSPTNFDRLSRLVKMWSGWIEETFADIVGTLIAGPAYVDSALLRQEETAIRASKRIMDDGEHPMPYLRPLIGLKTLEWVCWREARRLKTGGYFETDLKQFKDVVIEKRYQDWLNEYKSDIGDEDIHPTVGLTMRDIEESLETVVFSVLGGRDEKVSLGRFQETWVGREKDENGRLKPEALGNLFEYDWWAKPIMQALRQGKSLTDEDIPHNPLPTGQMPPDQQQEQPTSGFDFKTLYDQVRAEVEAILRQKPYTASPGEIDWRVVEVILRMELSEEEDAYPCNNLPVIPASIAGYYVLSANGAPQNVRRVSSTLYEAC